MNYQKGNTNTILIVIVIIIILVGGFWFYNKNKMQDTTPDNNGLQINVGGNAATNDNPNGGGIKGGIGY